MHTVDNELPSEAAGVLVKQFFQKDLQTHFVFFLNLTKLQAIGIRLARQRFFTTTLTLISNASKFNFCGFTYVKGTILESQRFEVKK